MNGSPPVLWAPDEARVERATITRYARWVAETRGAQTSSYDELWRWSVTEIEPFWASIWEHFDVRASVPYERVLGSRAMPGAEWFPEARLNYAEHVFRSRDAGAVAIRHASELRPLAETTWGELHEATRRFAAALRSLGIGPGDRVVAYLPNIVEAVVAFHACASLGAVWSSCSPDFGARSVVDRFAQIEPRVLLTVDGYRYGGRDHDRLGVVRALQEAMPTLEHTIVLGYLAPEPEIGGLRDALRWDELLAGAGDEELAIHAGAVRPPALGPLLVGDDGPPEGDRARARRDPARAAQDAAPPRRPAARRPAVLVHDDRLDDVELPERGAAHRGVDRPLRRQPGIPRPRDAVGPGRARRA